MNVVNWRVLELLQSTFQVLNFNLGSVQPVAMIHRLNSKLLGHYSLVDFYWKVRDVFISDCRRFWNQLLARGGCHHSVLRHILDCFSSLIHTWFYLLLLALVGAEDLLDLEIRIPLN